jgi:hypothetical protein
MVLVASHPSCIYLANAMSPSVNLIATGRWFKGMKGAAASSLKNMTNKGVAWRGVSDTLLTLNGILNRTSSVWRQLFHCLVFGVGEMGEFTRIFRHNPTDRFGCMYIYVANTCVIYIRIVIVIRKSTCFNSGLSLLVLGGWGGILHTSNCTEITFLFVCVVRGKRWNKCKNELRFSINIFM